MNASRLLILFFPFILSACQLDITVPTTEENPLTEIEQADISASLANESLSINGEIVSKNARKTSFSSKAFPLNNFYALPNDINTSLETLANDYEKDAYIMHNKKCKRKLTSPYYIKWIKPSPFWNDLNKTMDEIVESILNPEDATVADNEDETPPLEESMADTETAEDSQILPYEFTNEITCNENISILTQSIAEDELNTYCTKLSSIELIFHETLKTQFNPVDGDLTDRLIIYIFANYEAFKENIAALSGIDFNIEGSFFFEGNANQEGNIANIYLFDQPSKEGLWGFTHEYIHYLNAKYVKAGNASNDAYFLFFEEGLAEYFTKIIDDHFIMKPQEIVLSNVIKYTEENLNLALYFDSYWVIKYLIEEKNNLFDDLVNHLQANDHDSYIALLDYIIVSETENFNAWYDDQDISTSEDQIVE